MLNLLFAKKSNHAIFYEIFLMNANKMTICHLKHTHLKGQIRSLLCLYQIYIEL